MDVFGGRSYQKVQWSLTDSKIKMTETIIPKCSIDEHIPEDRNYSKYNVFTKLLFFLKSNNSEKLKKWKNKINHFVDAQERFKPKNQKRLHAP